MSKITLNIEESCLRSVQDLEVKEEDIVTIFVHKDCTLTVGTNSNLSKNE